jgi:hypothetical protein
MREALGERSGLLAAMLVTVCLSPAVLFACPATSPAHLIVNEVSFASKAVASIGRHWSGERFVYVLDSKVAADAAKVATFEWACEQLLGATALRCTPRSAAPEAKDYVYVIDGGHDFSYIGRQGGCQVLSILTWSNPMVVAHEIKHALGWAHEQQHPDRDRYLDVDFAAIPQRHRAEFEVRNLGNEGPYDFDSIMHFFPSDFASPGQVAFRPKQAFADLTLYPGQRDHLSETDLEEIREIYGAVLAE